jgi:hypothetical protein
MNKQENFRITGISREIQKALAIIQSGPFMKTTTVCFGLEPVFPGDLMKVALIA